MIFNQKNNLYSKYSSIVICIALLLLQSVPYARAQSSPPPEGYYQYAPFNPTIAIIIVILVALLFLMGFFSIYIRRQANEGGVGGGIRTALSMRRATASRGLDGAVIETFPTFVYSTVKGVKIGKGALECAVCLNEYEDEETLRLIPKCDHVFHPECIDAWLENHVTCPVCRANLVPDSGESDCVSGEVELGGSGGEHDHDNDHDRRRTTAEGEEHGGDSVPIWIGEDPAVAQEPEVLNRDQSVKPGWGIPRLFEKFRSHSTGHSLVQPGENLDRFTLRLPEDVRRQVVNRALLNRMGSTVRLAGEGSARKGYRTGVGSGRRRSYKRFGSLDRVVVRSERWVMSRAPSFLTRGFSGRSPKGISGNGEASTSSTTADKIPLHNNGPKSC